MWRRKDLVAFYFELGGMAGWAVELFPNHGGQARWMAQER